MTLLPMNACALCDQVCENRYKFYKKLTNCTATKCYFSEAISSDSSIYETEIECYIHETNIQLGCTGHKAFALVTFVTNHLSRSLWEEKKNKQFTDVHICCSY